MTTPPLGRPVGATGEQTRQRIIAAAMRCVAEVGYSRATIREIARMADITSANLYNYFPNKTELIRATIAARSDIALPRLRAAAGRPGTAATAATTATTAERIDAVLAESGRVMREYPDLAAFEWEIRAHSDVALYPGRPDKLGEPGSREELHALRDIIRDIVDDAHRQGALGSAADARATVEVIYALVHGLTELAATRPPQAYRAALKAATRLIRGTLFTQVDRG